MSAPTYQLGKRLPALDGLRACAVLAVMAYHFLHWGIPRPADTFELILWKATQGGWMGVNLFFVLSGFLITGLLIDREKEAHYYRNFYVRRACRILPAYLVTLVAILLLLPGSAAYVGLSALFISNFADLLGVAIIYSSLWSLCVEEHFYLVWPWITRKFSKLSMERFCLALCVAVPLLRAARVALDWPEGFYTWFWLDSLAWGAWLALVCRRLETDALDRRAFQGILFVAGLIAVAGAELFSRKTLVGSALGSTVIALVSGLIVYWVVSRPRSWAARALSLRPLQVTGSLSYGLYLYHSFFVLGAFHFVRGLSLSSPATTCLRLLLGGAGTFVVAAFSYRYLERPFLQIKDRFTHP